MKLSLYAPVCALLPLAFSTQLAAHTTLQSPNGGERLIVGSTVTITWTNDIPHNTVGWDLEYSTSGNSAPWLPIAIGLPPGDLSYGAVHTFTWTVPAAVSSTVRVRVIQDNAGRDYMDVSDADLAIVAAPASFTAIGQGCSGSAGVPTLSAQGGQLPRLGGSFSFEVTNVPATAPSTTVLLAFAATPPIDLGAIGMPGCVLRILPRLNLNATPTGQGTATATINIPNDPALIGGHVIGQAFVVDPASSTALGATLSNAGDAVLGS